MVKSPYSPHKLQYATSAECFKFSLMYMGPMHYRTTTWTRALAIAQSQPLLKTKDSQVFLQKEWTINQGCCLTGAQSPEVHAYDLPVGDQNFKQGTWREA